MRKFRRFFFLSLVIPYITIPSKANSNINQYELNKQEIIRISGIDNHTLEASVESISIENNIPKEQVITTLLNDFRNEEIASQVEYQTRSTQRLANSVKGDIWFSKATTSFYKHGHVGLYQSSDTIIEARGAKFKVATRKTSSIAAKSGDLILGVSTTPNGKTRVSAHTRNQAINFANSKRGKAYASTVNNKKCGNNNYNCSQLVWCAYKNTSAKIDLDSDGSWFVSPTDIKNSNRTYIIRRY